MKKEPDTKQSICILEDLVYTTALINFFSYLLSQMISLLGNKIKSLLILASLITDKVKSLL